MITACLQVKSSKRPSCDQILRMPGLLNHLTGTLDKIESTKEETKSLMGTIRLPRNLGKITESLPASKYEGVKKSSLDSNAKELIAHKRAHSARTDDLTSVAKTRLNLANSKVKLEKSASSQSLD